MSIAQIAMRSSTAVPDIFFDKFVKEVYSKVTYIASTASSNLAKHTKDFLNYVRSRWVGVSDWSNNSRDVTVVAVDGGVRAIPLQGGHEVIVARAVAVGSGKVLVKDLTVELAPMSIETILLKLSS